MGGSGWAVPSSTRRDYRMTIRGVDKADLRRAGREGRRVQLAAEPQPWGWWAVFADQDGNRFALG